MHAKFLKKYFVGEREEKRTSRISAYGWDCNIKMNVREIGCMTYNGLE